ncbi:molybdenum cofactor biosynthesis protein C [Glarea lozoyensis ATCC 20868]|uniref:Molybdenum cofactor biosynthesis protein C n=1 Tax=Glarea lozoyensis (strain ATCC 20868 / MF5171) TaxID=1116229 RepID=S3D9U1_GLAL2|nr:molybdenum cofactor biosynthesis protein C [Glarea lozoyensis ATCC 20868]EPE33884.1 molybdenum cofactor biosynthesis protein C [Glarea lozoyensis ATCC 20868]
MEYDSNGPNLKPLLLINVASPSDDITGDFRVLQNGQPAFELALGTLHDVLPNADTIYICVQNQLQVDAIEERLSQPDSIKNKSSALDHEQDHPPLPFPKIHPIFLEADHNYNSNGLLAAAREFPQVNWLVLVCDYPILPPPALQQLILDFEQPVTCFVTPKGSVEPFVGIWTPAALRRMVQQVAFSSSFVEIFEDLGGRKISPLRLEWLAHSESI